MMIVRRTFTLTLAFLLAWTLAPQLQAWAQDGEGPTLSRIKMVTIATPDLQAIEDTYVSGLRYQKREDGAVSAETAESWGTPAMTGRPYILMSPVGAPDVYIRAVEIDAVPDYEPMTTFGWNSFELVIDDVDTAYRTLIDSNFQVIGEPHPLTSVPTIHTMQVRGPADEILYLADETIEGPDARLPQPGGLFGRPFIVILSGRDIVEVRDWYADKFNMEPNSIRQSGGEVVPRALGLPPGTSLPISLLQLSEFGNRIQLDGYDKGSPTVRARTEGQLPPGNAIVTFSTANLDSLDLDYVTPPRLLHDAGYEGLRAATVIGPAGELLELVEEPRDP